MAEDTYDVGTGLEIPGIETVMEYGDASTIVNDRIPGSLLINDRTNLEKIRVQEIDGLADDPDGRDSRQTNASRHGETAGQMLYGGRTIGLTGQIEAGSIPAVRDGWGRMRSRFGTGERDLLVHTPQESRVLINEIPNPTPTEDTFGWPTPSGATLTPGVTDGLVTVASLAIADVTADSSRYLPSNPQVAWDGEDVWLTVKFKISSATATVTSFHILLSTSPGGFNTVVAAKATPTTGSWYKLAVRVPASSIEIVTTTIGMTFEVVASSSGNATYHWRDAAMVLLQPGDDTPLGPFDATTPDFESEGIIGHSRSFGPCYSVNRFPDTLCQDSSRWEIISTATIFDLAPNPTRAWHGDLVDSSMYFKTTIPDASFYPITFTTITDEDKQFSVIEGRTYKVTSKFNILQRPSQDVIFSINWKDETGTALTSTDQTLVGSGVIDASIEAVAPAHAVICSVAIHVTSNTSGAVFEVCWSDPCFLDISSGELPAFSGDGEPSQELVVFDNTGVQIGARRRIARPWLLNRVRKTSDMKAPDQQQDERYARPFTMSLRAGDPRVYVLDERTVSFQLGTNIDFVHRQTPDDFDLESGTLAVPTGFTYESDFITCPGGAPFEWSQLAANVVTFGGGGTFKHPNQGVGIKGYFDVDGSHGSNRPSSDILTRMFRSAEGNTYHYPRVVLGCAPFGFGTGSALPTDLGGWPYQADTTGHITYANQAIALLKRVDSSTWIELRWSGVRNDYINEFYGGTQAAGTPFSFELWCSHNMSGSATPTRLASVDMTTRWEGGLPFPPLTQPYYLTAWIDTDNLVNWELWTSNPNTVDFSTRIEQGSYQLNSTLIGIVGGTVAGAAGFSLKVPKAFDQGSFNNLIDNGPFIHSFESSRADLPPTYVTIPVIGTIDTPQVVQLRGDLVDPVVSIVVPPLDGMPARVSTARFSGLISDSNPIFIDLSTGAVKDGSGLNRYDLVVPGQGDFATFRPGLNYVNIQAASWGEFPAHALISWRDALR